MHGTSFWCNRCQHNNTTTGMKCTRHPEYCKLPATSPPLPPLPPPTLLLPPPSPPRALAPLLPSSPLPAAHNTHARTHARTQARAHAPARHRHALITTGVLVFSFSYLAWHYTAFRFNCVSFEQPSRQIQPTDDSVAASSSNSNGVHVVHLCVSLTRPI